MDEKRIKSFSLRHSNRKRRVFYYILSLISVALVMLLLSIALEVLVFASGIIGAGVVAPFEARPWQRI